jgi:hypothetical protein
MIRIVATLSFVLLLSGRDVAADSFPQLLGVLKTDTTDTFFGERIIPLGDQDGDGFDDVLVFELFRNSLFYGGATFDSTASLVFENTNSRTNCIGDINNDGFPEFTAQGRAPFGWKLNLYLGGPTADTLRDFWFGYDTLRGIGFTVKGNDINGNGTDEIISWEGVNQKSVLIFELGVDSDSIPDMEIRAANDTLIQSKFGRGIASGDFNGDGKRDLAVSYNPNFNDFINGSVYLYWGVAGFDTIPDLILTRVGPYVSGKNHFGEVLENLGDVNGDGYNDLFASSGGSIDDTVGFIYFGGPSIDPFPDVTIPTKHTKARSAGDVNRDGYQDLIISLSTPFSTVGWVEIFLGGLSMDSIPDVRFDVRDTPNFHNYYGLDCSGIGDFNGDGIDDFAFSAARSSGRFQVYIYAGWDSGTDVEIKYEDIIPSDYFLFQNYPNPFNPATTIQFSLPIRNHVALKVLNVNGQEVAVLINKTLSAGQYKVTWDGRDHEGNEVASGVYFYKLETKEFVDTKKMVLLR